MNKITLKRGGWTEKIIYATGNHRWILKDGQITTNLKVGDVLLKTPSIAQYDWEDLTPEQTYHNWKVVSIEKDVEEVETWCLEVEDNHSFILSGGIVTGNCCLLNLEDMLQNGTVINKTLIEKPHSFSTACTIATQIMACIASGQHGGQSVNVAHLAPFVDVTRQKIKKELEEELKELNYTRNNTTFDKLVEKRVRDDVKKGVQTMQYQINTLNTSNG